MFLAPNTFLQVDFYLEVQYVKQMKVELLYLLPLVGPEVQPGKLRDCKPQDGNN